MLRRYHIARFAHKHSPEREERLLAFAEKKDKNEFIDGMHEGDSENITNETVRKNIENITNATREKLKFLNDLAGIRFTNDKGTDNTILNKFFSEHHPHVEKLYKEWGQEFTYGDWSKEVVSNLTSEFMQEVQEIARRSKEKMGPQSCAYLSHASFVRQYMSSIGEKDTSSEAVEIFCQSHTVPSAYFDRAKQSIIFDLSDARFNFKKQLSAMGHEDEESATEEQKMEALEIVENNRQRAVVHELAHYSLDYVKKYDTTSLGERMIVRLKDLFNVKTLDDHPQWNSLKNAVFKACRTDGVGWTHEDVLHEGLAMLVADNRNPEQKNKAAVTVANEMRKLLQETKDDEQIQKLLSTLNGDLEYLIVGNGMNPSAYDDAMTKINMATKERNSNEDFANEWKKRGMDEATKKVRELNPDLDEEIAQDIEETAKGLMDVDSIIAAINSAKTAAQSVEESKASYLKSIPSSEAKAEGMAMDHLLEHFNADLQELNAVQADAEILKNWDTLGTRSIEEKNKIAAKYGFSDVGSYADGMTEEEITALDKLNINKRSAIIPQMADVVVMQYKPIVELAKILEESVLKSEQDTLNAQNQTELSLFQKIQNALGSKAGIKWLSIYDLIKIYNIYKDAVVERYQANQKIRIYDAAKEWNVWSPLQPDLDKQAKSANDEETEKFKEYLKKDGFTYNQLFDDNGVLDQNRGNINRAKAVIDYAADHAWLYKLDRTNGHDVYGVDYQGNWGARTFEELVEHNAEQQERESAAGKSKVENYPEIDLIIEDMLEELERKNIWKVHGMMKRLQEKAKLSESNTWAVTTLFRAMRDDPDVLNIMDIGLLDKIGNIGISQSAWAMTLYKTQRKNIVAMKLAVGNASDKKKAVAEFISNKKNKFIMGEVISEIESLLPERIRNGKNPKRANSKYRDYTELDHEVAKVLAGQTVYGDNGKIISIFDNTNDVFNRYRKYYIDYTNTTPTNPGDTDPDFFNPDNGGSDVMLLGSQEYARILEHQSQGPWVHQSKAANFVQQLLLQDVKLGKISTELQQSFRDHVRGSMSRYTNNLTQQAAAENIAKISTRNNSEDPVEINNKSVLNQLFLRDMITEKQLQYILSRAKNFNDADKTERVKILKDLRSQNITNETGNTRLLSISGVAEA